jgi:hypothetical protein
MLKIALLGMALLACAGTQAQSQDIRVEVKKGDDLCPELRVINKGPRTAMVTVEYDITAVPAAKGRGGSKTDTLPAPVGTRVYQTNVMGVYCHLPYKFDQRIVNIELR